MGDILDGSGTIITDGDGLGIYDGDGASPSSGSVTITTTPNDFVKRVQRDINAPDFEIEPVLYDIVKEFTERTWVLYRSYEIQGADVADSIFKSVAFDLSTTAPGLVPIAVKNVRVNGSEYRVSRQHIVGDASRINYEVSGVKFYDFFPGDGETVETNVRIYPWDTDPLMFLSVAFKTVDEPTTIPAILLDYKEEICCGVMSRMMLQPSMGWYKPELSGVHRSTYEKGISKAKLRWFSENASKVARGRRFI